MRCLECGSALQYDPEQQSVTCSTCQWVITYPTDAKESPDVIFNRTSIGALLARGEALEADTIAVLRQARVAGTINERFHARIDALPA